MVVEHPLTGNNGKSWGVGLRCLGVESGCQNGGRPVAMERNCPAAAMRLDKGRQPLPSAAWEESIQSIRLLPNPTLVPRAGPSLGHTQTEAKGTRKWGGAVHRCQPSGTPSRVEKGGGRLWRDRHRPPSTTGQAVKENEKVSRNMIQRNHQRSILKRFHRNS